MDYLCHDRDHSDLADHLDVKAVRHKRTMKLLCTALLFAGLGVAVERGQEIKLWPNGAPGSEGITADEVSKPSVNAKYNGLPGNFTVTHHPSIYVFLPPHEKTTGAAMG